MKIMPLAATALVAIAGLSPTIAAAQQRTVVTRTVTHTHTHTGPAIHRPMRQVCHTRFDHGHRVRVCRTVRY